MASDSKGGQLTSKIQHWRTVRRINLTNLGKAFRKGFRVCHSRVRIFVKRASHSAASGGGDQHDPPESTQHYHFTSSEHLFLEAEKTPQLDKKGEEMAERRLFSISVIQAWEGGVSTWRVHSRGGSS